MKTTGTVILFLAWMRLSMLAAFACEFKYDAVSAPQYYRAEGWTLPGAKESNPSVVWGGQLRTESIPGAMAQVLAHESPYVVDFPAQEFLLNGTRQKMRVARVQVSITRWLIHRHTVAYSYTLTPVMAHSEDGHWIIDAQAACIYFATFIDDKGDGVFRILVPDRFTAALVPLWAKSSKN
jgi:hypothetical protein